MQETVKKLNLLKKQRGYTLKQLAELSGLTLGTVNKIMSGSLQKIKADKLARLAKALNVTVDYLTDSTVVVQEPQAEDDYLGLASIACITPEVRVGDCAFNAEQIVTLAKKAYLDNVKIAVFPELSITGYSCGDLFFQRALRQGALDGLKKITDGLAQSEIIAIVGLPFADDCGKMYNAAAVCFRGEVLGIVPKTHLPNYNEFIEKRLFAPFDGKTKTVTVFGKQIPFGSDIIFTDRLHPNVRFSIEICEDVWVADSPSERHAKAGANAIFNLSASNETVVKSEYRKK